MKKKTGKKMSASLKAFLKRHGRFPKKGELRRGGGGSRRRSHNPGNPGPAAARKGPGLGASYQAAKLGVQVAAPVTNQYAVVGFAADSQGRVGLGGLEATKNSLVIKDRRDAYLKGTAIGVLDSWLSRKYHVAGAISRKSITALAPEVYAGVLTADGALGSADVPQVANQVYVRTTDGYDPAAQTFSTNAPGLRTYHTAKWGGVIFRGVRKRVPAIDGIVNTISKTFLSPLGLTP